MQLFCPSSMWLKVATARLRYACIAPYCYKVILCLLISHPLYMISLWYGIYHSSSSYYCTGFNKCNVIMIITNITFLRINQINWQVDDERLANAAIGKCKFKWNHNSTNTYKTLNKASKFEANIRFDTGQ